MNGRPWTVWATPGDRGLVFNASERVVVADGAYIGYNRCIVG